MTGLKAPKGMNVVGGILYATGVTELVDIAIAIVTGRYPVEGASFLNDVAAAPDGRVFVPTHSAVGFTSSRPVAFRFGWRIRCSWGSTG